MGEEIKRNKKKRRGAEGWGRRGGEGNRQESNNEHTRSRCKVLEYFKLDFFLSCRRAWNLAACPHSVSFIFFFCEILSDFQQKYSLVRLQLSYMHGSVGPIYMNIHTSLFRGSPWRDASWSTHCLNTRGEHVDLQQLILTLNTHNLKRNADMNRYPLQILGLSPHMSHWKLIL